MRAAGLNAEFGIAGSLDFRETEHGLVKAVISLDGVGGEIYLQGAQLTAWQRPGGRPVLFTSPNSAFTPGRAIRGGVPIIFPWFGPNASAPEAPQHGFARTAPWRLAGVEAAGREALTMTFRLEDGDVASPFWPEKFRASYSVRLGRTLALRLAVQNLTRREIRFEEALHTYFAVSDIANVAISGLAGATFVDKTQAGARQPLTADPLTITAETDSVFLDTHRECAIADRGWDRHTTIAKDGAASTVVWNPWAEKGAAMADLGDPAWRHMVCVETGNIADKAVRLAGDSEHAMTTTISVGAIPAP